MSRSVIKAAGLAKGKGVTICYRASDAMETIDAVMRKRKFGDAGTTDRHRRDAYRAGMFGPGVRAIGGRFICWSRRRITSRWMMATPAR